MCAPAGGVQAKVTGKLAEEPSVPATPEPATAEVVKPTFSEASKIEPPRFPHPDDMPKKENLSL